MFATLSPRRKNTCMDSLACSQLVLEEKSRVIYLGLLAARQQMHSDEFDPLLMYQGSSCKGRMKRRKTQSSSPLLRKGAVSASRSGKNNVRQVRLRGEG